MSTDDREFLRQKETYKLIGAGFEVYNKLGCAYLEPIYQEAYEKELGLQFIPYTAQSTLRVPYKEVLLKKEYFADLIAYEKIIVELKVLPQLTSR